jgi:hypothetical protein
MRRPAAPFALATGLWVLALLAGCAAPGDPTARHPVVPVPVADLTARQSGGDVVLSFSLPSRSMDREALVESPAIEIYRATLASGATPDKKTSWRLVDTIPPERVETYLKQDRVEFHDPLPSDALAQPSGNPLAYMVRTRVVKARASGDSNLLAVRIYPPPEPPRDLRTTVTESAIVIMWTESLPPSNAAPGGYHVYRAEIDPGTASPPQDTSQAKLKSAVALVGPSSTTEFRDSNFEFGKTYLYTVRAVAQFGGESVESADSAPTIVTPRDVFSPAAPAGLESTVILATPQAPSYVELSWAISSEGDLAGYYVYRSDREDTPGDRLNEELLPSPTFRDTSVVPGGRYFYRISAVDRAGNESPKSSAIQTVVP